MPSIEIVCIGQASPLELGALSFAVEAEPRLISHRGPTARFQSDFNQLLGCIYHLGNPELRTNTTRGAFFAYELLSEQSRHSEASSFLEFAAQHWPGVCSLLALLVEASPSGQLLFTSDWQFGPPGSRRFEAVSLPEFVRLHEKCALQINAAYPITRAA
jgi:hypothetical protein